MTRPLIFHDDRLFPADERTRSSPGRCTARSRILPIISPHGHTDPAWFATNAPFEDATDLLLAPDHYLFRMLYSQGISLDALKVRSKAGVPAPTRARPGACFAQNFHLFRGTPSWLWLNHVFSQVFGFTEFLTRRDLRRLFRPHQRGPGDRRLPAPRAVRPLQHRDPGHHRGPARDAEAPQGHPRQRLGRPRDHRLSPRRGHRLRGRALRPTPFERFGEVSARTSQPGRAIWKRHRLRRQAFIEAGATSSDHGHPTAATADLSDARPRRCSRAW
jgi:glucuronate isomerase